MKINILDAGLREKGGHHFEFVRRLQQQHAATGHKVRVYGYREMDDEVVDELGAHGAVTRLFRRYPYYGPRFYDPYAGDLELVLNDGQVLAEDLGSVDEADVWIWPSFRVQHLNACVLHGASAPIVGCIHEDPGVEAKSVGAMLWRAALLSAVRRKLRITIGSIEGELRHRFMPILPDRRFAVFPQPFEGPSIAEPRAALKRIGFFGHQRGEKGNALIGPLIERLAQEGYAITVHSSGEPYKGPMLPQIEVLGMVDDMALPMRECDLIVLPYDIEQYNSKGSGILAQARALGIPVAAPFGTLPGRLIEQHRIGPLFGAATPQAIYEAIKFADRNYAAYAANALRAAQQFVKHNGAAPFAAAFLDAAGLPKPAE